MATHAYQAESNSLNQNLTSGILFILIGSSSYGMLSTFVKLAYKQSFTTAEVTASQFIWGALILTILDFFLSKNAQKATSTDIKKLMIAGIPMALTSVLYYLSVQYIDASVGVVLLMQSVWMGIVVEAFQTKRIPSMEKIAAVAFIIFGTLLATKVLGTSNLTIDIRGLVLGILTAMSFSWTLYSTNTVASHLAPVKRSKIMLYGGLIVVLLFTFLTQIAPHYLNLNLVGEDFIRNKAFDPRIFLTYGLIVAIFGTVIPPIMLNKGFPIVGVGLGSILSSVELPVAMCIAFTFLGEVVSPIQWVGVFMILAAIVLMNYKTFSKT